MFTVKEFIAFFAFCQAAGSDVWFSRAKVW
jgi:hypothetical protein